MAKWELITERKDSGGYYIGWHRVHPLIHEMSGIPAGKSSIVQIGGHDGAYVVRGMTVAHSVFSHPGETGVTLYDKSFPYSDLEDAKKKVTELKKQLAEEFDILTRSSEYIEEMSIRGVKSRPAVKHNKSRRRTKHNRIDATETTLRTMR